LKPDSGDSGGDSGYLTLPLLESLWAVALLPVSKILADSPTAVASSGAVSNYAIAFVLGIFGLFLVWKLIKTGLKFIFYVALLVIIILAIINLV
jgi:hypothetical protein